MPSPSELSRTLFGIQRYAGEQNFTNWTDYTPTWTPGTGSFVDTTTDYATYITVNPFTYFNSSLSITDVGTAVDFLWMSLPLTISGDNNSVVQAALLNGGVLASLTAIIISINNVVQVNLPDGTTPLANGNTIMISGYYRTAIQE